MVDRFLRAMIRAKALTVTIAALAVTAVCCVVLTVYFSHANDPPAGPPAITEAEVPGLCGWAGPEQAKRDFAALKGQFLPFLISRADGRPAVTEDRRAVLSDKALDVLGHPIDTLRQEIGDCTSFGAAQGLHYLQVAQIAGGEATAWRSIFPSYIYGCSRVLILHGQIPCRSDGSTGAATAAAMLQYGAVATDEPGVPEYSGRVAKDLGCKGPSKALIDLGKTHLLGSAAKVTRWEEARDALVNGYPVTIASNVGFRMSGTLRGKKLYLPPAGEWAHQMVLIGYDVAPERSFLVLNSWGPNAHTPVNQDGPPGSFWITVKTCQRILDADDSFALSAFAGFPQREWDLNLLRERGVLHEKLRMVPGRAVDREPWGVIAGGGDSARWLGSRGLVRSDAPYAICP